MHAWPSTKINVNAPSALLNINAFNLSNGMEVPCKFEARVHGRFYKFASFDHALKVAHATNVTVTHTFATNLT